ncbi:MAG: SNF2 helicase associated domain-containing protein [Breznakia sp.]
MLGYKLTLLLEEAYALDFLNDMLPTIQQYANVYVSKALRKLQEHTSLGIQVGVRVKNDLLYMDIDSDVLKADEIQEVLKSYRKRKKYHKLKNGELIMIPEAEMVELDQLFEEMNVQAKDIKATIKLPLYEAYRMEGRINQLDVVSGKKQAQYETFMNNIRQINIEDKSA